MKILEENLEEISSVALLSPACSFYDLKASLLSTLTSATTAQNDNNEFSELIIMSQIMS
jgi:hypothetical protein